MKKTSASILTNDSSAFSAWAKMANAKGMTAKEAASYLAGEGVHITPKGTARPSQRRGPLEVGEVVKVDGTKCTHPENVKNCGELEYSVENPQYCVILEITKPEDIREACTIIVAKINLVTGAPEGRYSFKAVDPAKGISGLNKKLRAAQKNGDTEKEEMILRAIRDKALSPHNAVGLYRAFRDLPSYLKRTSKKTFAIVYDKGGESPTPQMRKNLTREVLEVRKKKTSLHGNFNDLMDDELSKYGAIYYEGEIISAAHNSSGEFFFTVYERGGRGYTSINPNVGRLYFLSSAQDMPAQRTWVADFKARINDLIKSTLRLI